MISKKTKYGLRVVLLLAREYGRGPLLISEVAEREGIPKKFLELILLELKNKGILQSKKGKGGGYSLGKAPESVTFGQVVRALEGPLAPVPCVSQTAYMKCEECRDELTCGIRIVMKQVRDATARIVDGTTLAQVLRQVDLLARDRQGAAMYFI